MIGNKDLDKDSLGNNVNNEIKNLRFPMIKVTILFLLFVYFFICVSCDGTIKNEFSKVNYKDLTGYRINLENVSALGIYSTSSNSSRSLSSRSQSNKNYLVMAIGSSYNQIGYDETGVIEVTFIKNGSQEVNGETTITQEEINGEIDKLYVLEDYTFVSFVLEGTSQRPESSELVYDTDGIAIYDKTDYFSGSSRQSYIIDNVSGLIYKIEDFNIKSISGGCLVSADDDFIYDFRVNENGEIEIFSLFQNPSISWVSCFKDKYGIKYIQNDRINTYDSSTKTFFYVFNSNSQDDGLITYELTSNKETIKLEYSNSKWENAYPHVVKASIVQSDGECRDLNLNDNFKIYYGKNKYANVVYKVEAGIVYGYNFGTKYSNENLVLFQYNGITDQAKFFVGWNPNSSQPRNRMLNLDHLEDYDIVIEFSNNTLSYFSDIWTSFSNKGSINFISTPLSGNTLFNENVIVRECNIENDTVLKYGISGNSYYDIVVEEKNGVVEVNPYLVGSYTKSQIKYILQPINR